MAEVILTLHIPEEFVTKIIPSECLDGDKVKPEYHELAAEITKGFCEIRIIEALVKA